MPSAWMIGEIWIQKDINYLPALVSLHFEQENLSMGRGIMKFVSLQSGGVGVDGLYSVAS